MMRPGYSYTKAQLYDMLRQTREENVRLRNKLLECAKECSECNGTGVTTTYSGTPNELVVNVVDCPDCLDIRSVLL